MAIDGRLLDDLARLAAGAVGTATGLRDEVNAAMRDRLERWIRDLDLPTREELESARAMAAEARRKQEDAEDRLTALEAKVATLLAERAVASPAPGPKRPARKAQGETSAGSEG